MKYFIYVSNTKGQSNVNDFRFLFLRCKILCCDFLYRELWNPTYNCLSYRKDKANRLYSILMLFILPRFCLSFVPICDYAFCIVRFCSVTICMSKACSNRKCWRKQKRKRCAVLHAIDHTILHMIAHLIWIVASVQTVQWTSS